MRCIELTGQKFGKLTVVEKAENNKWNEAVWRCKCECGNETFVSSKVLRLGHSRSCGCYKGEAIKKAKTKHGKSNTKTHKTGREIKSRCFYHSNQAFRDYGGRGITMCERWQNSFEAFYEDVSKLPHFGEKGYSLDRIDNNGNYEPNNVRWATSKEQNNNKRNNRKLNYNGETHTLSEWANIKHLSYTALFLRLRRGWSIEKALETPQMHN